MKKILFITTGGTIASAPGKEGLAPAQSGEDLLQAVPGLARLCHIDIRPLLNMDSSNMQPENWVTIAEAAFLALDNYDGVVIAHGTDTMAYTAAALSFMLQKIKKPVILTGSQIPMGEAGSDAPGNIYDAFCVACDSIPGVYVVFGGKVIRGCRASKIHTRDFQAFASINCSEVARVKAGQITYRQRPTQLAAGSPSLNTSLCPQVALLKLIPGTRPELLTAIKDLGYRGLVIEAFGLGGVPFQGRNLLPGLEELVTAGLAVAITSQCLWGEADLSVYEVGRKALKTGVIPAYDMATEALVAKLMWALGQGDDLEEVTRIMLTNYAGEIGLPG
ncbi:MAG: asparaginase [bacterium]|nr:asparaginase [Bacillota bacterium]HHW54775.1 asparaginase [Bacillota bacterium]